MIKRAICWAVGFVIGCALAIAGAPIVCLAEDAPIEQQAQNDDGHWEPIAEYKLTAYCGCRRCNGKWAGQPCANGRYPAAGYTVACGNLPLGTHVFFNGHEYVVEDRGVYGNHIDIYMDSHSEARQFGVQRAFVFKWVTD